MKQIPQTENDTIDMTDAIPAGSPEDSAEVQETTERPVEMVTVCDILAIPLP